MKHDTQNEEENLEDEDSSSVYIVWWMSFDMNGECIEGFSRDDCSLIGVYSTRANAEAAIERARLLPGFKDYPEFFIIDPYKLNEDHWTSGLTFD
jgi:hypothetical protein